MGLQALEGAGSLPVPREMSLRLQLAWRGTLLQVPEDLLRLSCDLRKCESAVGWVWVNTTGRHWPNWNGSEWLLLWPFLAAAGASSSRISQCPRNESLG